MEPKDQDVKEKVGTWLKQLPQNFGSDDTSYLSSIDDKSASEDTSDYVTGNGSNDQTIAHQLSSWDPMKYVIILLYNLIHFNV